MVVGARVVVVCFPLVLGVRSRSDGSRQPHPSTCALVDVKSPELGADRLCGVAPGAVLSCSAWCRAELCMLTREEFYRVKLPSLVVFLGLRRCLFG